MRTAATRQRVKPVSEIALGVSRDSMSRLVTTAWYSRAVVGRGRAMPGGEPSDPARRGRSAGRGQVGREDGHLATAEHADAPRDADAAEAAHQQRLAVWGGVHPHAH